MCQTPPRRSSPGILLEAEVMVAVSKVGSLDAKIASLGAAREDRFPLRRC
jgi:hypothetical protein